MACATGRNCGAFCFHKLWIAVEKKPAARTSKLAHSRSSPRDGTATSQSIRQAGQEVWPRCLLPLGNAECSFSVLCRGRGGGSQDRDAEFCDRDAAMTRLVGKYLGNNCESAVFANYGAGVKLQRKILHTEFLSGLRLKAYEAIRGKEMAAMVDNIFSQIESSNNSSGEQSRSSCVVGFRKIVFTVNQNVIFKVGMGKRFDDLEPVDEIRKWPALLDDIFNLLMKFNLVDFIPWLEWLDPQGIVKALKMYGTRNDGIFDKIIERLKQTRKHLMVETEVLVNEGDHNPRNLLDVLLRPKEEGGETSDHFFRLSIHNLLMTAIHTTANQMEWALLQLVRHPSLLRRLQNEIDEVVGKERPVRESDFQALPFLNAIVMETLRLHQVTPFSFPHVNKEPSTLGGYHIPPRTAVLVNIRTIGRDPKAWTSPLQFNPDRFMEGNSKLTSLAFGSDFNSLPFSSGRRMCPGGSYAMAMLLRTVATLVHAFDLSPPLECTAEDLSIEEDITFVLQPTDKLFLTCRPRLSRHVYQDSVV